MAVKKPPAPSLADALRDLAAAAPSLRAAGVTRVVVGDIAADLAPDVPDPDPRVGAGEHAVQLGDLGSFFGPGRGAGDVS